MYPYKTFRDWFADEESLGNVIRIKTPIKCGDYKNIVDIGYGIPGKQPETEIRAVARYLHSLAGKPMAIIENPINNRPDIPVIVNPWPTRDRVLRGMGLKNKEDFFRKYMNVLNNKIPSIKIAKSESPCKEVIIPEESVDLRNCISRCRVEFNQNLWSTCNGTVITYDPETKTHNLGKMRTGQYEWKDANPDTPFPEERIKKYMFGTMTLPGFGTAVSNTGRFCQSHYFSKNKPMPAAFAFGIPTDMHMVAAFRSLRWPETGDEYEMVGGFRGQPVEVVESETIPDLMVPAQAEWVIEGEFIPEVEITPPYGEDVYIGIMMGGMPTTPFKVKCVTHRRDPWWTATTFSSNGMNGHDGTHSALKLLENEASAVIYMRHTGFKVKDVVATSYDNQVNIIQMEVDGLEKSAHYGKQAGMAYAACPTFDAPPKYIIVVGPDIDPYDLTDVMWALGTRSMPISDSVANAKAVAIPDAGVFADLSKIEALWSGEQVIIDALIKMPERYKVYPPRSEPVEWEKEAIERMRHKID